MAKAVKNKEVNKPTKSPLKKAFAIKVDMSFTDLMKLAATTPKKKKR